MPDLDNPLSPEVCEGLACAHGECQKLIDYFKKLDTLGIEVAEYIQRSERNEAFCRGVLELFGQRRL